MNANPRGRAELKQAARGVKREADDSLDDDQRFAKRFDLLNIDHNGKLYVPIDTKVPTPTSVQISQAHNAPTPCENDSMQLDDTRHRVYIHNLDDELADIESEDEKLIFLPDIERKLNTIPKHVLTGRDPDDSESHELVLYTVPKSLSVPEERDSVRKAIIEARHRAMKKAAGRSGAAADTVESHEDSAETAHGFDATDYIMDDPDAMDIG